MGIVTLDRGGAVLVGHDHGAGIPLVFQHGLGGSALQVAKHVPDVPGVRRLTLDCRGQGVSGPGEERPFSFAMFEADVLAFCEACGVDGMLAGGLSMGAALALRLAVHHPARVRALILARPAWLFEPAPATLAPYAAVAAALRADAPATARRRFAAASSCRGPDETAALSPFFDRPDPAVTADLLEAIAADGPGVTRQQARRIDVPTLVIGHRLDPTHPFATAMALADTIPGARLVEVPPKAAPGNAHVIAFRAAVGAFLQSLCPMEISR